MHALTISHSVGQYASDVHYNASLLNVYIKRSDKLLFHGDHLFCGTKNICPNNHLKSSPKVTKLLK